MESGAAVGEALIHVGGIAEGLVGGAAAAAEGVAVALLVLEAIGAVERHAASDEQGAADPFAGILQDDDAGVEFLLENRAVGVAAVGQAPGGAVPRGGDGLGFQGTAFCLLGERPDVAVLAVAEAGVGAAVVIEEVEGRPLVDLGPVGVGRPLSGLGPVEADALVGAVAEGLMVRSAAAAEAVFFLDLVVLHMVVFKVMAIGGGDDGVLAERDTALDYVGAVRCGGDGCLGGHDCLFRVGSVELHPSHLILNAC